jgi:hypothetical protein
LEGTDSLRSMRLGLRGLAVALDDLIWARRIVWLRKFGDKVPVP